MFINPEKVPVTVYRSDDADAPRLDHSANSIATIFKACLVTGYGSKKGAGWTIPYEDTVKGIRVLRPKISLEHDFYLRLSNDNGKQMTAQVYLDMTEINIGDLKLQCDTPFKYNFGVANTRWVLIACDRAFVFFSELPNNNGIKTENSGVYFYCGDTSKNTSGDRAIYLKHTGGTWSENDDDRSHLFDNQQYSSTIGKLYETKVKRGIATDPVSLFTGSKIVSAKNLLCPSIITSTDEIYFIPLFSASRNTQDNYTVVSDFDRDFIVHSTTSYQSANNVYVPIDYWEF
ncbi:hypothetical protein [Acinetobacter sp. c3-l95]|uniref:hypothetical protein n=1 Tax=Acinetobacter sp. c3-l95 TaxID=3342804 RepID=UPI0035B71F70